MDPANKKALGARGIPQPFNRQAGHAPQLKPVVAQPKTAVSAQSVKRPVAPPVYRPQQGTKAVQPKMAQAAPPVVHAKVNAARLAAPAVYRPQNRSQPVQAKTASAAQVKKPPVVPPVYRPQPTPKVLQTKQASAGASNSPTAGREMPKAPAVYKPNNSSVVVQRRIQAGGGHEVTPNARVANGKRPGQPESPTTMMNARVVQRTVNVSGETDAGNLWANVRDLVDRTWGRKKKLYDWAGDGAARNFGSLEDLADSLDKEFGPKTGKGRVRPDFTPKITSHFNQTWGGKRHRRHVVMSSAMRNAVYAVTDKHGTTDAQGLLNLYKGLVAEAHFPKVPTTLEEAETALVIALHNNPANLVLDEGSWNSAIGALATNVRKELQTTDFPGLFAEFTGGPDAFLDDLVGGFQPHIQQKIVNIWKEYVSQNPITDEQKLRNLLYQIYDNAAADIMTKQKLPKEGPKLLGSHVGFEQAAASGDPATLEKVCKEFIGIGNSTTFNYANVW